MATLDTVLAEVALPYMHELGQRWERGEVSVAQEHFASTVLRGRLLGLARGWGRGLGPRALLACLPGEQHDLGLIAFGLTLRARGWRIAYLGGDMPIESVISAAHAIDPAFVVLSAVDPESFLRFATELRALAGEHRTCIGGAGAREAEATAIGATLLSGGPVEEADRLTELSVMRVVKSAEIVVVVRAKMHSSGDLRRIRRRRRAALRAAASLGYFSRSARKSLTTRSRSIGRSRSSDTSPICGVYRLTQIFSTSVRAPTRSCRNSSM